MKVKVCGNCSHLKRLKGAIKIIENGKKSPSAILWGCISRWWSFRPNNEQACDKHEFKNKK